MGMSVSYRTASTAIALGTAAAAGTLAYRDKQQGEQIAGKYFWGGVIAAVGANLLGATVGGKAGATIASLGAGAVWSGAIAGFVAYKAIND